jgi:hypothetical protein
LLSRQKVIYGSPALKTAADGGFASPMPKHQYEITTFWMRTN